MLEALLWIGRAISQILMSVWFWLLVGLAAIGWLSVVWYRGCKTRALERVEYTRSFPVDGMLCGDHFAFTESVRNPTLFPLFFVKVEFFVPAGLTVDELSFRESTKVTSVFHIPPHATVKKTHVMHADKRGYYRFETATVRYRRNEFEFLVPAQLYVFPNCSALRASPPPALFRAGDSIAERKSVEDPFFLSGIRPYLPGDPLRAVNFKASLRSFSGGIRRLMSNSYDSSRSYDAMIVLDLFEYPGYVGLDRASAMETGLCYASYLLEEALRQDARVGFAANCALDSKAYVYIPCGTGQAHTRSILESFAKINEYARRDYSVNALLMRCAESLGSETDLYLITRVVDEQTALLLRRLERMGRSICVIPLTARPSA